MYKHISFGLNKKLFNAEILLISIQNLSIALIFFLCASFAIWYAAVGPIMPFWDDWRYFMPGPMNYFHEYNPFMAQNDTLFIIPSIIDVEIFKRVNFNFAFARYLSLAWLFIYVATSIAVLRKIFSGYFQAAAILMLSLPLAIGGYWDDGTYIAYHQGLPLVFGAIALNLLVGRRGREYFSGLKFSAILFLSIISGLTYISGFIPFLSLGIALLILSYYSKYDIDWGVYRKLGLLLIFISVGLFVFQFFSVSTVQGSLLERTHASATASPFDYRFWIFFFGLIGKGFGFRGANIYVDIILASGLVAWLLTVFILLVRNRDVNKRDEVFEWIALCSLYAVFTILMYAAIVSYGRAGLLPSDDFKMSLIVAKSRFHYWWISALAPFAISGFVLLSIKYYKKYNFNLIVFIIYLIFFGFLLSYNSWNYQKKFSAMGVRENSGIDCLIKSLSLDTVLCGNMYPQDIKYALNLVMEKNLWPGLIISKYNNRNDWNKYMSRKDLLLLSGGSVDGVKVNDGVVTFDGWLPVNSQESNVNIYVYDRRTLSVVDDYSALMIERPDVVKALGRSDLLYSGFSIKIRTSVPLTAQDAKTSFCIYGIDQSHRYSPVQAGVEPCH